MREIGFTANSGKSEDRFEQFLGKFVNFSFRNGQNRYGRLDRIDSKRDLVVFNPHITDRSASPYASDWGFIDEDHEVVYSDIAEMSPVNKERLENIFFPAWNRNATPGTPGSMYVAKKEFEFRGDGEGI